MGEGSTGCVIRPGVRCDTDARPGSVQVEGRVSKLMHQRHADHEWALIAAIKAQLATAPPEVQDSFILGDEPCKPFAATFTSRPLMQDINAKCSTALSATDRRKLQNGNADDVRVINQMDGGTTLSEGAPAITTADDLAHLCQLALDLIDSLRVLGDRGVVHGDIKLSNMVLWVPENPDVDPPKLRLIDWSHAVLLRDLYTPTGLRQAQLQRADDAYHYVYFHPPWMMLLDLQEPVLQTIFGLNAAGNGDGMIQLAIRIAADYLTRSPAALRQSEIKNRLWTMCLNEAPFSASQRAELERTVGRFFAGDTGIGHLSRDCAMYFVFVLVHRMSKWTHVNQRSVFVDCVARAQIDAYGVLTALVALLYAQRGVQTPYFQQARHNLLQDLAKFAVEDNAIDTSWLRPRFNRLYRMMQRGCNPGRAFPSFMEPGEQGGAAAAPPGGAVAAAPVPEFSPATAAALQSLLEPSVRDAEADAVAETVLAAPEAAAVAAEEYSVGGFEQFLDTLPDDAFVMDPSATQSKKRQRT